MVNKQTKIQRGSRKPNELETTLNSPHVLYPGFYSNSFSTIMSSSRAPPLLDAHHWLPTGPRINLKSWPQPAGASQCGRQLPFWVPDLLASLLSAHSQLSHWELSELLFSAQNKLNPATGSASLLSARCQVKFHLQMLRLVSLATQSEYPNSQVSEITQGVLHFLSLQGTYHHSQKTNHGARLLLCKLGGWVVLTSLVSAPTTEITRLTQNHLRVNHVTCVAQCVTPGSTPVYY